MRVVVSLTSHPPRYSHLHVTLDSLLAQSYKPDEIILWLTPYEYNALPLHIKEMEVGRLNFRMCGDLGPYKKIIPALRNYPDAYIVTCDDDAAYPREWLQTFVDEYRADNEILCQFAKQLIFAYGEIVPYKRWPRLFRACEGERVFPNGRGGVFYPPGSLDAEVMNAEAFMRLAPRGDDIWKYWMGLGAGSVHRFIPPRETIIDLPTSLDGLWSQHNRDGGNDKQITAMVEAYGLPWEWAKGEPDWNAAMAAGVGGTL